MRVINETTLRGYRVTFIIESKKDATDFHNKIAIEISQSKNEWIGDIYNRGMPNDRPVREFDIALKENETHRVIIPGEIVISKRELKRRIEEIVENVVISLKR